MTAPPRYLMIVERGRPEIYATLKDECARLDSQAGVQVVWDRRSHERRTRSAAIDPERRRRERRQAAPALWTTLGMMLVAAPGDVRMTGGERAGAPMDPRTVPCNHPTRPCRLSATLQRRLVKDGETWFHYACPAGHRFHQRVVQNGIEARGCECRVSD